MNKEAYIKQLSDMAIDLEKLADELDHEESSLEKRAAELEVALAAAEGQSELNNEENGGETWEKVASRTRTRNFEMGELGKQPDTNKNPLLTFLLS